MSDDPLSKTELSRVDPLRAGSVTVERLLATVDEANATIARLRGALEDLRRQMRAAEFQHTPPCCAERTMLKTVCRALATDTRRTVL